MWALSATKGIKRSIVKKHKRVWGKYRWNAQKWLLQRDDFWEDTWRRWVRTLQIFGEKSVPDTERKGERPWKGICYVQRAKMLADWSWVSKGGDGLQVRSGCCHTLNRTGPLKLKAKTLKCSLSDRKCFQKEPFVYYTENWLISGRVERVRPVESVAMSLERWWLSGQGW